VCINRWITEEEGEGREACCPADRRSIDLNAPDLKRRAFVIAELSKYRTWMSIIIAAGSLGGVTGSVVEMVTPNIANLYLKGCVTGGIGWITTVATMVLAAKVLPVGSLVETELGNGIIGGLGVGCWVGTLATAGLRSTVEMVGVVTALVMPIQIRLGAQERCWGAAIVGMALSMALVGKVSDAVLPRIFLGGIMGGLSVPRTAPILMKIRSWEILRGINCE
jgi:hypothetical protein